MQEFDDCQDLAGKPIPGWFFRKLMPPVVLIAMHDRAPQLKVSEDRLSVTGDRGYCMVRGTHGAHLGSYYYEVTITDMPEGSAARIGWSQELGNLQGPCGYDRFSYSWRSRKGTAFHDSRGKHFSDDGFRQGDTLGFLIHLPPDSTCPHTHDQDQEQEKSVNRESFLPPTHKERPLVKFKSYFYFEQKDEVSKVSKCLRPLFGSQMICYKNGEEMGSMFADVNAGTYYPAASLYKNVTLTFNFGPDFRHRPDPQIPSSSVPSIRTYKAVQDLAHESSVLQSLSDILYFTEKSDSLKVSDLINSFATHG